MNARDLIVQADQIRREQGLTQAEWSRMSGLDEVGMAVCRTYKHGNCKLTTLIRLLKPLGYGIKIIKLEDMP